MVKNRKVNKSMKFISILCLSGSLFFLAGELSSQIVSSGKTMESMVLANKYFMEKWPDNGNPIVLNGVHPGNIWSRGVYYEGLMSLYKINPEQTYLKYALDWGEFHKWGLYGGIKTRDADNQCCGQTYIDLYLLNRYKEERIIDIKASVDSMIVNDKIDDWSRIDALQMAMPVFARLGFIYKDDSYFDRMHEMYLFTKLKQGTSGLYSMKDHLWWRDKDFVPPYKEPNGENCYWSRGNGWVIAALVRTMEFLPKHSRYRSEYLNTLNEMFDALVPLQRTDGFWNVSLYDSTHFAGKEVTGTALIVYGMAWGINEGVLSKKKYLPVVMKAWNAIITESLHPNGFLGFVQGTGNGPKDSQPVGYDIIPDTEDFGLGCFLLAGSEVYKVSLSIEPKVKVPKNKKEKNVQP
jgi:unsaturated rhamnogalacturonyl hydrolase